MKILLDPQTFNEQKFGGISRYYTELYLALNKMEGVKMVCPIIYSDNLHLKEALLFKTFRNVIFESALCPKFIRKKIVKKSKKKNIRKTLAALEKRDFDIFIPTYYTPYFLNFLGDKPNILTVYDMIHEIFPQYFTHDLVTVKNKKLLLEKATMIIAISESTKQDIITIYPFIDPNIIEVVYLSHSIKTGYISNISLPEDYILFVGNRSIYKNFNFFLKAMAPILKSNSKLFIVCAGGNKFNTEELLLIRELKLTSQLIQQNFEDHDLASYYSRAQCFVFASEYEGFGIPVLESMVCGCPVVLAHHSSFPEVAGEAGVYFELNNAEDLQNKVSSLLENITLRNQYIQKGLHQAKKFSWEKTAAQCLKVYQKAINK
ncbi:MAG: glycosyltransferase family 4 protein [Burkholderiales bacterium]|nr:glycosyltransferase family 4 protein [Flavobacterium sp.]